MADVGSQRTGAAEVACAVATAVSFFVAVPYLDQVYGMLDSPGFFAWWRWAVALRAFAIGGVALSCQVAVLVWSRCHGLRSDLVKLAMYALFFWVLLTGFMSALYGLSRVYPLRMYLGPYGLAGPSWAERYGPARTHVRCPPGLKINPRNGGPARLGGGNRLVEQGHCHHDNSGLW